MDEESEYWADRTYYTEAALGRLTQFLMDICKHPDMPGEIADLITRRLQRPLLLPLTGDGFGEGEDAERRGEVPVMRGDQHG